MGSTSPEMNLVFR